MAARFIVVPYSQSAHCCFEATVVDTTKPTMHGDKQYMDHRSGKPHFEPICECFEADEAEQIAAALNAAEPQA